MSGRGRAVRNGVLVVALLAMVAVVVPDLVAHRYDAFGIPRSDDWSYLRTAFRWSETGHWDFNNWVSMTLVGQIVLSTPALKAFEESIAAARIAVGVIGVIGLAALVFAARTLGATLGRAVLLAVCLAVSPLWPPLVSTYMSDVPAFAFQTLALALAIRGLHRRPIALPWVFGALAASFVAISIRQYAVVTLGVIAVVALWCAATEERRRIGPVLVGVAVTAVASIAVMAWSTTVPRRLGLDMQIPNARTIRLAFTSIGGWARLAGLVLLPLVVAARPITIVRSVFARERRWATVTTGLASAVLLATYAMRASVPFVGNYVDRRGVLADDIIAGSRPFIMPTPLFVVLALLASASALVLVIAAVPWMAENARGGRWRRLRDRDPAVALIGWTLAGSLAAYELAILIDLPIFDRYALAAVPLPGLLLLRMRPATAEGAEPVPAGQPGAVRALSAAALVGLAALGLVYSAESASFDAARWKVAQATVDAGYGRDDIFAGYEWVGWWVDRAPPYRTKDPEVGRPLRRRYLAGLCINVVISADRRPAGVVAVEVTDGFLRGPARVFAVRVPDKECTSGRP